MSRSHQAAPLQRLHPSRTSLPPCPASDRLISQRIPAPAERRMLDPRQHPPGTHQLSGVLVPALPRGGVLSVPDLPCR